MPDWNAFPAGAGESIHAAVYSVGESTACMARESLDITYTMVRPKPAPCLLHRRKERGEYPA